jgi:hypothetical protein
MKCANWPTCRDGDHWTRDCKLPRSGALQRTPAKISRGFYGGSPENIIVKEPTEVDIEMESMAYLADQFLSLQEDVCDERGVDGNEDLYDRAHFSADNNGFQ